MTTGEYLVAHSSLPTGTAMAHWLSAQSGDRIIYCSQRTAVVEHDEVFVICQPKKMAQPPEANSSSKIGNKSSGNNVFSRIESGHSVTVFMNTDQIVVTRIRQRSAIQ